jgi:3-dehydroquinate synthase
MLRVMVPLGVREYGIEIGTDLLCRLGEECARLKLGRRCVVISDRRVAPRYGATALGALREAGYEADLMVVPSGEGSKSVAMAARCYDRLARARLERGSFVVALGGGVVGDLAGFVAATYLRGMDFVQVPTTLLAQVDSSVGGKVGVNLRAGKNLVGAFHQPRLVLCDLGTLETLPDREYRAGLAEVIKYGIIRDRVLFERLERELPALLARDTPGVGGLGEIVARCCEIKAEVVGQDETESGLRAILNFGHTIGHGLEAISGYGRYLHGEAISIGQVLAARLSAEVCGLKESEMERIRGLFERAGLPTEVRLSMKERGRLIEAMRRDKKVVGGTIGFVVAERIGRVRYGQVVAMESVERVLGVK